MVLCKQSYKYTELERYTLENYKTMLETVVAITPGVI